MNAPKIKVAFGRYVCNVRGYILLFAKLPYNCRGCRVVDCHQDHVGAFEIGRLKDSVDMGDLFLFNSVRNLFIEARRRTDDNDIRISVEAMDNAASRNLLYVVSKACLDS